MTELDLAEVIFLIVVVAVGVGGIAWVVKNDKR